MLIPLSQAPRAALASIRLLATDIDGTMTRSGRLDPGVIAALATLTAFGIEVLPVTGRPSGEALGLARYLPGVRRAIAENGATLVLPDEPLEHLQPPADVARLESAARQLGQVGRPWTLAPDAFCRVGDRAWLREGRPDAEIAQLREAARGLGLHLIWSNVHIHLSSHPPDKGAAVLEVARRSGVSPHEIATIGDAPNDEGLWRPGRFGLPVGTAEVAGQQEVLAHAPQWTVGPHAQGWVELAEALIAART